MNTDSLQIIAKIQNDFPTKFGIPRQSGLVPSVISTIVFEPDFRNADALRGIEEFSHIWLLWGFSETEQQGWSPTVRPPRLGGNVRKGVFATRSPFRPNAIGLSSVKLNAVKEDALYGTVLQISGADLISGTPIYDIKPYLPLTDCHPDATDGFAGVVKNYALQVQMPEVLTAHLPNSFTETLCELLAQDPRPAYQNDPNRIYGFMYAGYEIKFSVENDVLTVQDIIPQNKRNM